MSTELMELARGGLVAWQRGDLSALAEMLDPDVELLWWEPGQWDCRGKDAVVKLLSERSAAGETDGNIDLVDAGGDRLVVSRIPTPSNGAATGRPSTLVTFNKGLVVRMRQFRSLDEALAASV